MYGENAIQTKLSTLLLKKGVKVVLTKAKLKEGCESSAHVGIKRAGTLSRDFVLNDAFYFKERGDRNITSSVLYVFLVDENTFFVETVTSFFILRIVTKEKDLEFAQHCGK